MPLTTGGSGIPICDEPLRNIPTFTRKRRVELIAIANACLEKAEEMGVKDNEHCEFGRLCEMLWR
jgi:hypothetical protein